MGSREGPAARGRRRGRRLLDAALQELHDARLDTSITQQKIGAAIGKSDAWVCWTESGQNEALSVIQLSEMLACVGLELSLRAYPAGGELRDRAQTTMLARFRSLVAPHWRWNTEVPIPLPGDLRAWDAVLRGSCTIGVDAETRIRDIQAVDRRVMLKLRDSGLDRAIILLPSTRANRAALQAASQTLLGNYPVSSRVALAALKAGRDPGGNAIVVLPAVPIPAPLE